MDNNTIAALENLYLALADKTRLKLLSLMANGEVSVGFLADELGESQPKISRHLAYLRNAGLVSTRRDGKWIYYGVETQNSAAVDSALQAALAVLCDREVNTNTNVRAFVDRGSELPGSSDSSRAAHEDLPVYLL